MAVHKLIFPTREEWLVARKSYIGGSDVGAILGINPWQTNIDLWEIKTGRKEQKDISHDPLVEYGTKAEQYLRELYRLDHPEYELLYEENNMWLNDTYPAFHSSLDGWLVEKQTGRRGIWECKTSTINSFAQLKEKWGQGNDQRIPDTYFAQVCLYLLVTEFDFVELTAQIKFGFSNNKEIRQYHIERSEVKEDIEFIAKKGDEFAKMIKENKRPSLLLPEL